MTKILSKVFTVILVALVVVSIVTFAGCGDDVVAGSGEVHHASTETAEVARVGMEKMGTAGDFVYYRDTSTDVMYLWRCTRGYNAGYGGLTVMMNPETGKPLIYADWVEFEEGEYNGSDENTKSSD